MGVYDRDYFQDDDGPRGFTLGGRPRMVVTNLVLATIAVFVVNLLLAGKLDEWLALPADLYRRPWQIYQLLTYGFLHADIWHIALNMFMLWMFGRVIEARLGRLEFLLYYLAAIVVSGLTWLVLTDVWAISRGVNIDPLRQVVGASGGVTAVFLVFVLFYPRETVYLWGLVAIPAWLIGAIVIGQDLVLAALGKSGNTAWQAHIGGAAFAFVYLRMRWRLSRLLPTSGMASWKIPGRGPRLRVHDPDDEGDELAAEADRILAKVHREGEQSLSNRERRILERYSRQVRDKRIR